MEKEISLEFAAEAEHETNNVGIVLGHAEHHLVESTQGYEVAGSMMVQLQTYKRRLEELQDYQLEPVRDAKRNLDKARKRIMELYAPWLVKIEVARHALDKGMTAYRVEERRKQEMAAEKERAAALKREEDERRKRETIAKSLAKKGLDEEAAAVMDRVDIRPSVAPVAVPQPLPQAQGTHVKRTVMARVVDFAKLPDQWKLPNQKLLDSYAKQTDGQVPIPGVEFYVDEKTVARRAR